MLKDGVHGAPYEAYMRTNLNPREWIDQFIKICHIAEIDISNKDIEIEERYAPHRPPSCIPNGKMAVYVFIFQNECLKVGKAGPNSHARYVSQHYNPKSSNSNLAKSVLKIWSDVYALNESNIGSWIKTNTHRYNFILDEGTGIRILTFLETFLQCKLKPRFEGFESQK